jgi:hypothetical protein
MSKHRGFEALEDRRMLSIINPPPPPVLIPVVIAPPEAGFSPILLPPGLTAPPGTSQLPSPPTGQLPPGLPPLAGAAEQYAVNSIDAFSTAHPTSTLKVTDHTHDGSFTLTLSGNSGNNFYTYTVTETKNSMSMDFSEHDGSTNIEIIGTKSIKPKDGFLVLTDYNGSHLTQLVLVTDINGHTTGYQYPAPV